MKEFGNWLDLEFSEGESMYICRRDLKFEGVEELSRSGLKWRGEEWEDLGLGELGEDMRMNWEGFCDKFVGWDVRGYELRVESMERDSCKLFHGDNVLSRMIIVYYGLGTEYLDVCDVNWENLGVEWSSFEEYNDGVVRDWGRVRCLGEGDIGVMMGERWGFPCIHRAPDVEEGGLSRFLFVGTIY